MDETSFQELKWHWEFVSAARCHRSISATQGLAPGALRRTARIAKAQQWNSVPAVKTFRRRSPPMCDMQAFAAWFEEPSLADVLPTTVG